MESARACSDTSIVLSAYLETLSVAMLKWLCMKDAIATLAKRDMPLLQKGEYPGGRYAYIDANEQLKLVLELLEND